MINDEYMNNLRSEASRLGYYSLPLDSFLAQVFSSFKSIFNEKREVLDQTRSRINNDLKQRNKRLNEVHFKLKKSKVEWYHIVSFCVLIIVLIGIAFLWQNLVWGNLANQYWIALGTATACCLLGSIINEYCKKMEKDKKENMLFFITAIAVLFTFVFSLESLETIYVVRSGLYSSLVGIIIHTINYIFFPIVNGMIGVLRCLLNKTKYLYYKLSKYRKENVLENIEKKLHQISEHQEYLTSATIEQLNVDYLLGQRASAKEDIEDIMNDIDYPSTKEEMAHA